MQDRSAQATWAILVAAGTGERLGSDRPKAFAALAGRPLLAESLERLDASDWVDAIVVAAPPEWEEPAILLAEELVASKVTSVVTGGATRAGFLGGSLRTVRLPVSLRRGLLNPAVILLTLTPELEYGIGDEKQQGYWN